MGLGHSHHARSGKHSSGNNSQKGQSNSDNESSANTLLVPIDQLSKVLVQKTLEEESIDGITAGVFAKYVFPQYPDLGGRLFTYFQNSVETMKPHFMTQREFVQACERFFTILADELQTEIYLRMYGDGSYVTPDGLRALVLAAYKLAMDHYSEGPTSCPYYSRTIQTIVDATFHRKESLSIAFLVQWIHNNCPRLTYAMHRYIVHVLSTSYRHIGVQDDEPSGLELSTPVLERESPFSDKETTNVLPLSRVWLLSNALHPIFIRPVRHTPPGQASVLTSQNYIANMIGAYTPSHWVPLYQSDNDGLGVNRFQHHVLAYRGPTLMFLRGEQDMEFCIASSCEWKESHLYWGFEGCMVLQLQPEFHCLAKGDKLLYFNNSIRGYPLGIRGGPDTRKPILEIDPDFMQLRYRDAPYSLYHVEVWGCGTEQMREAQLEIKRWEVKDAERARVVKMRVEDWVDHPDRYLLELAGRPSYSETQPNERPSMETPVPAARPTLLEL